MGLINHKKLFHILSFFFFFIGLFIANKMGLTTSFVDIDTTNNVENPLAIIGLIFNILLPGFGTILIGFKTLDVDDGYSWDKFQKRLFYGVLQFLLSPFIIGWIWALIWSIIVIKNS